MQNLEDLKDKIFFEAKNIIDTLSKISSHEELLLKKDLIEELDERISFIKILDKNQEYFIVENSPENTENEDVSYHENLSEEDPMEEEVLFTNELNEIHKEEEVEENEEENIEEEIEENKNEPALVSEEEPIASEVVIQFPEIAETIPEATQEITSETTIEPEKISADFDEQYRKNVEEKENELRISEENRRKIVEFEKQEKHAPIEEQKDHTSEIQEEHKEQSLKFKLANIKGLKSVQSLFDDDPLEKLQEKEVPHTNINPVQPSESSLLKTNIPTDFMEAEKAKPEFRLDLNDRIAFSKTLFQGSQTELNEAIRELNSFKNLEEAKEFLSDLYYSKNWKKHDEYAQRLWTLVENKFL